MESEHTKTHYRKAGQGNRATKLRMRLSLPILLGLILLIPVQVGNSAVGTNSGTTKLSNTLQYGNTAYSVDYSYPSVAQVGKNMTITVFLHVDALTGLAEYIISYQVRAQVSIGTQKTIVGSVIGTLADPNLYPGSVWGPKNITIPLTANNTELATGKSANASVLITVDDTIKYGGQISTYITEPAMEGGAGTFVIQNGPITSSTTSGQGNGQSYIPYALLATGAILMISAVFLPRRPGAAKN